ncbi:hypothetical protein ABEB36_013068 [Hypothenemus hampei]|uniref:MADF domain-containing protein n=1 Tax=Hypothenemus hampei TaxID=57062 RepID=A0ABD1E6Q0_HYPHA
MRDDFEFNTQLIAMIEAESCLYDHTSVEYANRNVQELAWKKISQEIKESVSDCKERWKNLRGAYTRYLKYASTPIDSATRKKKPYYLAEHMTFLLPFTKSRQLKRNIDVSWLKKAETSEGHDSSSDQENDDTGDFLKCEADVGTISPIPSTSTHKSLKENSEPSETSRTIPSSQYQEEPTPTRAVKKYRTTSNSTASLEDVNRCALEYFQNKNESLRKIPSMRPILEDPDVSFLMSLLPDLKEMNDKQKRRFKIEILNAARNILDGAAETMNRSIKNDRTPPEPETYTNS